MGQRSDALRILKQFAGGRRVPLGNVILAFFVVGFGSLGFAHCPLANQARRATPFLGAGATSRSIV